MSLYCTYCSGRGCRVCQGTGVGYSVRKLADGVTETDKGITIRCDDTAVAVYPEDLHVGFRFQNFCDEENEFVEVEVVQIDGDKIDIENRDENSEQYLCLWTVEMDEIRNINNSKKLNGQ